MQGCECKQHDRAKAAKESVWVPDPLWPEGYKKDLLEDTSSGDAHAHAHAHSHALACMHTHARMHACMHAC